jgi:hypothetical protein
MVAGPWFHGEWQSPKGDKIGDIPLGEDTAHGFRERIEAPSFRCYLHGEGEKEISWKVSTFQSDQTHGTPIPIGRLLKLKRRTERLSDLSDNGAALPSISEGLARR